MLKKTGTISVQLNSTIVFAKNELDAKNDLYSLTEHDFLTEVCSQNGMTCISAMLKSSWKKMSSLLPHVYLNQHSVAMDLFSTLLKHEATIERLEREVESLRSKNEEKVDGQNPPSRIGATMKEAALAVLHRVKTAATSDEGDNQQLRDENHSLREEHQQMAAQIEDLKAQLERLQGQSLP